MAITNRDQLRDSINTDINNNVVGGVTPEDIRSNMVDIVDSIHILASGQSLLAGNFSTPATSNTRAGEGSMSNQELVGYSSSENSAYGYFSLSANYDGSENSAFGTYSMSCNVYGSGNTAVGYGALGGNVWGDNNVAIGKHALNYNKKGDYNIAIGNAAGYYISENDSYELFIAAHPVTDSGMCLDPSGLAYTPLMRGDLLNNRLAINSDTRNLQGVLQVNGPITPIASGYTHSIGTNAHGWGNVFTHGLSSDGAESGTITLYSSLEPFLNSEVDIGSEDKRVNWVYASNLHVSGSAHIEDLTYTTIDNSNFVDKTIYLASSGVDGNNNPGAYLTDAGLEGAGFVAEASGIGYNRHYQFVYRSPDLDLNCLVVDSPYSRSAWRSNISLMTDPGLHVQTDRVLGREELSLLNYYCDGIFLAEGKMIYGTVDQKNEYDGWGTTGDITYFAGSGSPVFANNIIAEHSGVSLQDNLFSRNSGVNDFVGFKRQYIDAQDVVDSGSNQTKDRFLISSYGSGNVTGALTVMRDTGRVGINNLSGIEDVYPHTIFNVQSADSGIIRVTSVDRSSLQLGVGNNKFSDGVELSYDTPSGARISVTSNGTKKTPAYFVGDFVGINTQSPNAYLTVKGGSGDAGISIGAVPSGTVLNDNTGYGKFYTINTPSPNRSQVPIFQDDQGRIFDLMGVSGDILQPEFVFWDDNQNTVVGNGPDRGGISLASGNTVVGHDTLSGLFDGTNNTVIGAFAGEGIVNGDQNIFIGYGAGYQALADTQNTFELGNGSGQVLMSGIIPTSGVDGILAVNNSLYISNASGDSSIEIDQTGNETVIRKNYTEESNLIFRFDGSGDPLDLLLLDPSGAEVSISGDLNLLGEIKFSDGSYFSTSSGTKFVAGSGINFFYDGNIDKEVVNLEFSNLSMNSGLTANTMIAVDNEGLVYRAGISELNLFANANNPQTFWPSYGGYNLLLSNDTYVNHSLNTNNVFIGRKVGNNSSGHNASVHIGTYAGSESTMNNPSFDLDTASLFLGYNAGRKSKNAENSVFIGPSAGQSSINADKSVFIGTSAGQSSLSSRSIGLGDHALANAQGQNNIEITTHEGGINKLINGVTDNKLNVGGVIAGDTCTGRLSVGGQARIHPHAVMEVSANSSDSGVRLQEWYNSSGVLVAFLDQDGNMNLKGTVSENQAISGTNLAPATNIPEGIPCGNKNSGGNYNTPIEVVEVVEVGGNDACPIDVPDTGGINQPPPEGYLLSYTIIFDTEEGHL